LAASRAISVATERQTIANRRNAAKSGGPRSASGRNRTRHNALRHGLTQSLFANAETARAIEEMARKIVRELSNEFTLAQARVVAECEIELARIRHVKIALIERAVATGEFGKAKAKIPEVDARIVVAIAQALPDLRKILRYEKRAGARRDRALREILRRKNIHDAELYYAKFLPSSLLITESREEFERLCLSMIEEIKPQSSIENTFVTEVIETTWRTIHWRHCKTAMVDAAYRAALKYLLHHELEVVDDKTANELAQKWFTNKEARKEVADLLKRFGLDESAIEAEAMKSVGAELELFDRRQTSLEQRLNRALLGLSNYRQSVAERARDAARRAIDQEDIPQFQYLEGNRD
jgi:hypothetical protein